MADEPIDITSQPRDVRTGEQLLQRKLGKFSTTLIGIGASIGAGIFAISGVATRSAGPAVVLSFLIAAFACILDALCFAEFASRFPVAGSAYVYTKRTFGRLPALVCASNLLFDYHVGAALISRNLVHYITLLLERIGWPGLPSWADADQDSGTVFSFSLGPPIMIVLLSLVLVRGTKDSAWVNNTLTVMKVGVVVLVICAGAVHINSANYAPFMPNGIPSVIEASSLTFFSYIGFDAVASSAEECVAPRRTLPFAIITSLTVCAILYTGVSLVLSGLVPFSKLSQSATLSAAFQGLGMVWAEVLIDVGAVIGLTTTLFVGMYSQARVYLAMARDGLLPRSLARVHPRFGTPLLAQALCAGIAGLLCACIDVAGLADLLDVGILFAYAAVCAGVLELRVSPADRKQSRVASVYTAAVALIAGRMSRFTSEQTSVAFIVVTTIVALIVSALWFRRLEYLPVDSSAFACPMVPFLPAGALAINIFLMAQRPFVAWVRFAVVTILALAMHWWISRRGNSGKKSLTGDAAGNSGLAQLPESHGELKLNGENMLEQPLLTAKQNHP